MKIQVEDKKHAHSKPLSVLILMQSDVSLFVWRAILMFLCCQKRLTSSIVFAPPASRKRGRGRGRGHAGRVIQADQDEIQAGATYQGCAAAGFNGCCAEGNCKAASGCYCDVTCYYFRTCCDDITEVGCYRKSTPKKNLSFSGSVGLSLMCVCS